MNGNLSSGTPAELITARSQAFSRADFGFIYDSYHSESNFRRQFVSRDEYLQFGRTCLGRDYQIINCQIIAEKVDDHESQVIYMVKMRAHGKVQRYAELAWLRRENDAWRYHRGLKMTEEEFPVDRQPVTFADFNKLDQSTIF